MIVYEDRNRIGRDSAERAFTKLVSTSPPANAIERASFLYGMQSFCRRQLHQELTSALDSLDNTECGGDQRRRQAATRE
jgi:hypothetical protein